MLQRDKPLDTLASPSELELLRALADAERLSLLGRLLHGAPPQTVSSLADGSAVHLSGVSRHLAVLERAGIVSRHKSGREVHYTLNASHLSEVLRRLSMAFEVVPGGRVAPETEPSWTPSEPTWPASVPVWAPIDED